MIQIRVITKEDVEGGYKGTILRNLKPRRYMTSYTFQELMKYVKEELYWEDIQEDDVVEFEIFDKKGQWTDFIWKE